jgi:SAM-dependent methyltransferase
MKNFISLLDRAHASVEYRTGLKLPLPARVAFPSSVNDLKDSVVYKSWWYYTAELLPGLMAKGIYPDDLPMLPRIMLRNFELNGMDCLDIGSMEGLMSVLMRRGGARRILAVDAVDHCSRKMAAIKHYYGVDFDYQTVGLLYGLHEKLPRQGFDLINLSGLLYHVFSPLMVLAGVRPLLKKNGLLLVSTGVILNDSFSMEFNNAGRMQEDPTNFWYISVPLFDYMLRYLKLAPIDCVYLRHSEVTNPHVRLKFDKPSGYISVVCRAVDEVLPTVDDKWMHRSEKLAWEHVQLPNWDLYKKQLSSQIKYNGNMERRCFRPDTKSMDLWAAVNQFNPMNIAESHRDTHTLKLEDWS